MAGSFKVAPFGTVAWVWTVGFVAALIFFAVRAGLAISGGLFPDTYDVGGAIILAVLIVYGWLRSVKGYRVGEGNIVVQRAGPGRINFSLEDMASVRVKSDIGSFFNSGFLSIGGLFGWAGRARVRNPSDIKSLDADVYGTNPGKSVVLEMKSGRTVIVTPADPQAFAIAVRDAGVRDQSSGARDQGSGTKSYSAGVAKSKKKRR
ncbi:MAG TPA: PH domain-containing protein [Chloroflexia bacterium]|jgi:hypothetical protein